MVEQKLIHMNQISTDNIQYTPDETSASIDVTTNSAPAVISISQRALEKRKRKQILSSLSVKRKKNI